MSCPDYSGLPWLGKTRIFGSAWQTLKSAVVSIFLSAPVSLNRQHSSDQTWAQTCRILLKDIERHTCWIKHPLLVILHLDDFKMPLVCGVLTLKSYDCHEQSKCLPIHGESFLELAKIIRFNTFYSWIPRGWWGYIIYIYVCVCACTYLKVFAQRFAQVGCHKTSKHVYASIRECIYIIHL